MAATIGSRVTPTATLMLPASIGPDTPNRQLWLEHRRGSNVGSSDVPAILGVEDTPRTQLHVWHGKRGTEPDIDNEYMYWGRELEDTVAREWAKRNRSVVERVGVVGNVDKPWMLTSLDRRVAECPLDRDRKRACALEVKCRSAFKPTRFHREVPDAILAQTTWQYLTTGYDHIHVAALVGGNHFQQTVVRREDDFAQWVLQEVAAWRQVHLVEGRPPAWELDKAAALIELDKALHPDRVGSIDLTVADIGEVMEYARLARLKGEAAAAAKQQRAVLARIADGKQAGLFGDKLAFEFQPRRKAKVDLDLLHERWPEVYEQVVTEAAYYQLSLTAEMRAGTTTPEVTE